MKLSEFIRDSLSEIANGVHDANKQVCKEIVSASEDKPFMLDLRRSGEPENIARMLIDELPRKLERWPYIFATAAPHLREDRLTIMARVNPRYPAKGATRVRVSTLYERRATRIREMKR